MLAIEHEDFFLDGALVGGVLQGVGQLRGEGGVLGFEVGQRGVAGFADGGGSLFA
ncbi:hypothetical protein [Streptomyces sp. NPDC005969]|uniref:hypothetical protein n=1 Tax=Streptomyces sp. NPDC005969 TaxID=3156722 RepID=UPI0033C8209E